MAWSSRAAGRDRTRYWNDRSLIGGMIDDPMAEGRALASAASHEEYSGAMPPDNIYDEFAYYWTSAVAREDPHGNPVDAGTNDDGRVSMREVLVYAEDHDTASVIRAEPHAARPNRAGAAGTYWYRLTVDGMDQTRMLTVLKQVGKTSD